MHFKDITQLNRIKPKPDLSRRKEITKFGLTFENCRHWRNLWDHRVPSVFQRMLKGSANEGSFLRNYIFSRGLMHAYFWCISNIREAPLLCVRFPLVKIGSYKSPVHRPGKRLKRGDPFYILRHTRFALFECQRDPRAFFFYYFLLSLSLFFNAFFRISLFPLLIQRRVVAIRLEIIRITEFLSQRNFVRFVNSMIRGPSSGKFRRNDK